MVQNQDKLQLQLLPSGNCRKNTFSYKLKCWTPMISWLGTFGLLVIFLRPLPWGNGPFLPYVSHFEFFCFREWLWDAPISSPEITLLSVSKGIVTSGKVQHWKSTIHALPITLCMLRVKSDNLRIWNKFPAHAPKIRPSKRSQFLGLNKRSTASGDENGDAQEHISMYSICPLSIP